MHRRSLHFLVSALAYGTGSLARTVSYDWNVTWVFASPDGFGRPVIGINSEWPCPTIEANVGDFVSINLNNQLGNETTGLHFHGINQISSNAMDGAVGTSQCPLPPDYTVTYRFIADAPGTFWCKLGFSCLLYRELCRLLTLIRYRDQTPTLMTAMINPNNTNFAPPLPNSTLVNDGGSSHISVRAGRTYRLRLINWSAMFSTFIQFADFDMDVISIDASYVKRQTVQQLRISAAQRFDVLVTIPDDADENFPYLIVLDVNQDFTDPDPPRPISYPFNVTGMLVIDKDKDTSVTFDIDTMNPYDDTRFSPHDEESAYGPVTKQWVLNFDYCFDDNDYPRACFNETTYIPQTVPALYSAASLGENNTQTAAYGQVGAFVAEYGDVLEIIINNNNDAIHPFHLHGHQFQVLARPDSNAGNWSAGVKTNDLPPRRDVVAVNSKSYAVFRIKADNPGVFLFHCHVEWHVEMGLSATLIEAPDKLVNYTIPQDHLDACDAMGIPTTGNAAGNEDWDDTEGFVTEPSTTYTG
ncbi:putative ferroxidase [Hypoxylon sp. CI-4A]|nr:putative ferroxidase [Hypoxylon sp. CI-4A]